MILLLFCFKFGEFESSDPHGLSISLGNPACSVDSFEATPAQGNKRCRPISESPFGWSSGELIQLIHLNIYIYILYLFCVGCFVWDLFVGFTLEVSEMERELSDDLAAPKPENSEFEALHILFRTPCGW